MPVQFPSLHVPSRKLPSFGAVRTRFAAFRGRVASALQSIGRRNVEPLRPLQSRHVAPARQPVLPVINGLRAQPPPPPPEGRASPARGRHAPLQHALNAEIGNFDRAQLRSTSLPERPRLTAEASDGPGYEQRWALKHQLNQEVRDARPELRPITPREKDGLTAAKLVVQMTEMQDNLALKGAPLKPASHPPQLLPEPSWKELQPLIDAAVGTAAWKDFARQLGDRVTALAATDRRSPDGVRLTQEVKEMAQQLGQLVGDLYRAQPTDRQHSLAIGVGQTFRDELWAALQATSSRVPAPLPSGQGWSASNFFLDHVYNHAAAQLDTHIGDGDRPVLTFNGREYAQRQELGRGGGGIAYLYESADGHQVVVKSKGFGPDYEEGIGPAEMEEIHNELRSHLALMGPGGASDPNILQIKGVARTPLGQPVGILELAPRGDVSGLLRKRLAHAVDQKLISPQAAHLVRLSVLRDSINGMRTLHETLGARHADFKPGNLFIGNDGAIKVADFGTTNFRGEEPANQPQGTPVYMAPELHLPGATIGPKADTWAIGVFAHELFHGGLPFDQDADALIHALREYAARGDANGTRAVLTQLADNHAQREAMPGVTSADRLINALLHPDPNQRPALSDVLGSSLFDDLGTGPTDRAAAVRELIVALTDTPPDNAMIRAKASALGV